MMITFNVVPLGVDYVSVEIQTDDIKIEIQSMNEDEATHFLEGLIDTCNALAYHIEKMQEREDSQEEF